jgi:hypothetical protein
MNSDGSRRDHRLDERPGMLSRGLVLPTLWRLGQLLLKQLADRQKSKHWVSAHQHTKQQPDERRRLQQLIAVGYERELLCTERADLQRLEPDFEQICSHWSRSGTGRAIGAVPGSIGCNYGAVIEAAEAQRREQERVGGNAGLVRLAGSTCSTCSAASAGIFCQSEDGE